MTPIILDMDPGIDDAVALSIALTNPEIDIKLLTSVAGNVSVDKTTINLLKLTTFFKQTQVPVARGAAAPLKKHLLMPHIFMAHQVCLAMNSQPLQHKLYPLMLSAPWQKYCQKRLNQ